MPRIHVVPPEKTRTAPLPEACEGSASASVYIAPESFPLELHKLRLEPAERLVVGPLGRGRIGYVWRGAVRAGGHDLPAGSSFIVERGRSLDVEGSC